MPLTDPTQIPRNAVVCYATDCPLSARCLRREAADMLAAPPLSPRFMLSVNPRLHDGETCPQYLPDEPVRAARGFRRAHMSVPSANYERVLNMLMRHMSRNSVYLFRRGRKLILPAMQEKILAVLRECGAPEPVEFDAYEEVLDWGDHIL